MLQVYPMKLVSEYAAQCRTHKGAATRSLCQYAHQWINVIDRLVDGRQPIGQIRSDKFLFQFVKRINLGKN